MKLKLKNFAKIHEVELEFNGLTVIAGNNNTGKSTIGKSLFAIFEALHHVVTRIDTERDNLLKTIIQDSTRELLSGYNSDKKDLLINVAPSYFIDYINHGGNPFDWDARDLLALFAKNAILPTEAEKNIFLKNIHQRVQDALSGANQNNAYKEKILTRTFSEVFHDQINSLIHTENFAEIDLLLKQKNIHIAFSQNECVKIQQEIDITSNIMYIDNPFIIDRISLGLYGVIARAYERASDTLMDKKMLQELTNPLSFLKNPFQQILTSVITEEKLKPVLQRLQEVIAGKTTSRNNHLSLVDRAFEKPIKLENLSTGLKAFMILKLLIENNILKEKDLLVLDEPEVHLHPEWQILYAEIVVLLQKTFHLTVLLTTHSPYFLHAVEVYSKKYGIEDQCKYYLAENQNHEAYFHDVTGETAKIYQMMLKPFEDLQKLLYED